MRGATVAWLMALLLAAPLAAAADPLSMGVPEFGGDLDYLNSSHPAALLVRRAIGEPLLEELPAAKPEAPARLRLRVADAFSSGADHRSISLRLSPAERFANGHKVQAEDARFSLALCQQRGLFKGATFATRAVDRGISGVEEWVDVIPGKGAEHVTAELGRCPVLEKRSGKLFGNDLGHGSAIVGSGPYHISHFQLGRQIVLERAGEQRRPLKSLPELVTIRGFTDLEQGLAALRLGNIDALFSPTAVVREKARKDETLSLVQCSGYEVVLRKGLRLECVPEIEFDTLGYDHV